jgi:carnitine-CoA ligase
LRESIHQGRPADRGETLIELLEESAARWPERPLLLSEGEPVGYGVFAAGVRGLAGRLAEHRIGPGDSVAALLPNGPELLYLWMALARLGAILVPLNPALPLPEVEPLLEQVGICGLVADAETLSRCGPRFALRLAMVVGREGSPGAVPFATPLAESPPPGASVAPASPTTILQTSGTTGRAKGATLTHRSYAIPAREFGRWMEIVPEDRFLACLPLFHMAGQAFAMAALANGAALAFVPRFSGHNFWSQVRRYGITIVRYLGEMLAVLLQEPASPDDRRHTLRALYGGGARSEVIARFEARFGVPIVEGYGLTETNTVLRNEIRCRRERAIGKVLSYSEVRIADPLGRTLPPSTADERHVGEIQVRRNPVMMLGYVGDDPALSASFSGDWFRTGDLGYCDAEGYFYFFGRAKEIIRRRGESIVPAHVEEVLDLCPTILHSAVVGVPDDLGGEEVKAFLVCRDGHDFDLDAVVSWCRGRLAEHQIPRYFEVCPDLPRTSTNKIQRSVLRAPAPSSDGRRFDRLSAAAGAV